MLFVGRIRLDRIMEYGFFLASRNSKYLLNTEWGYII